MSKEINTNGDLECREGILKNIPAQMPYFVPPNYFVDFEKNLAATLKMVNEADYSFTGSKINPFEVPYNYFDNFNAQLLDAVYDETTLPELTKFNPLEVPVNYFEELPKIVLQLAQDSEKRTAKIIPIQHHNIWKPIRIAAAAILILGIGIGTFELIFKNSNNNTEKALATVPKNELTEYVQQSYFDVDAELTTVNYTTNTANALSFEKKDIIQYLNETGWDGLD